MDKACVKLMAIKLKLEGEKKKKKDVGPPLLFLVLQNDCTFPT